MPCPADTQNTGKSVKVVEIFSKPYNHDGMGLDFLDSFQNNEDTLVYILKTTEQPTANNVHMIKRNDNIDKS